MGRYRVSRKECQTQGTLQISNFLKMLRCKVTDFRVKDSFKRTIRVYSKALKLKSRSDSSLFKVTGNSMRTRRTKIDSTG